MLIEPQLLRIQPLATGSTPTDSLARRVVGERDYDDAIELLAQVDFRRRRSFDPSLGGYVESTSTRVTIRRRDADRASYSPKPGDRVVSVVNRDGTEDPINLFVKDATPDGVWGGKASQWVLELVDDHPKRRASNG